MGQTVQGIDLSIYNAEDALEKSEIIAEKYIKNIYNSNFTSKEQEDLTLVDEFESNRKTNWKRKEYSDSEGEDENAIFFKQASGSENFKFPKKTKSIKSKTKIDSTPQLNENPDRPSF